MHGRIATRLEEQVAITMMLLAVGVAAAAAAASAPPLPPPPQPQSPPRGSRREPHSVNSPYYLPQGHYVIETLNSAEAVRSIPRALPVLIRLRV